MMSRASLSVLVYCCIANVVDANECNVAKMYLFVYIVVGALDD